MSQGLFTALVVAVGVERLAELVVARRHDRASFARGGVESGRGHYPVMVALHALLLAGCLAEVWGLSRPFLPALGWPALALLLLANGLRWWCIASLGPHWTTRIVVIPGVRLSTRGPYRRLRHPNYVAVVLDGLALPLVHTAWITALAFTAANLLLLRTRIRVEEQALTAAASGGPAGVAGPQQQTRPADPSRA